MKLNKVVITVVDVRGYCPIYKVGDQIVIDGFYITTSKSRDVCLHALLAMSSLLSAILHGRTPKELGIGNEKVGYLQCPDPGPPHTSGGTVLFKIELTNQSQT